MNTSLKIFMLVISIFVLSSAQQSIAQSRTYQPGSRQHLLDHTMPPGRAGYWSGAGGQANPSFFQRVKFQVEGGGRVSFFNVQNPDGVKLKSPAQAGFQVGHVYRIKISDIPSMPGISVYPTIELMDRLHPPQGQEGKFAVPVVITQDEIRLALDDRLVTKVIFLEQPQIADPSIQPNETLRTETLPHHVNLIAEADQRGRPLMIFRMGGRTPDPRNPNEMFGTRGRIMIPNPPKTNPSLTRYPLRRQQR